MKQPALPIMFSQELIQLPAERLLEEFGAGGHSPGSGSAAALMGLLSAQLIATVCKITSGAPRQRDQQLEFVLMRIEQRIIPELKALFQQDAEGFDSVIRARQQRDQETDPIKKRRLREQALRLLEKATDLVISVSRICLNLVDYGLIVFDGGARKVRGDSGTAISAAIAGAMSGLFIINLNLRSFQEGRWANSRRLEAERLREEITRKQDDAFARITTLQPEDVSDIQPSFFE